MNSKLIFFIPLVFQLYSCKEGKGNLENTEITAEVPKIEVLIEKPGDVPIPEGMVWIPGGDFFQGAEDSDDMAMKHEKPAHPVAVDGFFMDMTEVTNAEFQEFVEATGYITVAERTIDWEFPILQLSCT